MDIRKFFNAGGSKNPASDRQATATKKPEKTPDKAKSKQTSVKSKTPQKSSAASIKLPTIETKKTAQKVEGPARENVKPKKDTKSDTTPASGKKATKQKEKTKRESEERIELFDSADDEEFQAKPCKKQGSDKKSKKSKLKDKNGNIENAESLSSPDPVKTEKKSKKAVIVESSEEEDEEIVVPKKRKKNEKKEKKGVIFDSESGEDEDPLPRSAKKRKPRKRKEIHVSDSDDECRQTRIEEVFNKSAGKSASHAKTPKKTQDSPPKKQISVADFFGTASVKQSEVKHQNTKRKAETSPVVNGDADFDIHDDDDFEETLRLLDESTSRQNKKQKVDEEEFDEDLSKSKKSLATKLSDRVKAGYSIADTPEKSSVSKRVSPKKTSPGKATPGKAMPKNSPEKISPKTATPAKTKTTSPEAEKTPLEKKATTGYKNYLMRQGPQALGSKEIPQGADNCMEGLTFVITGVLESLERDEAKSLIERYGGKVTGSLSKKTSYIVIGRDAGESKMNKVQQLGTKQLDEDDLLNLIRTLPGKKSKYVAAAEVEASKVTPAKPKSTPSSTAKETPAKKPLAESSTPTSSKLLPSTPKHVSVPSTPVGSPSVGANPKVLSVGDSGDGSLLWVDKYKPTNMKQIIGQQGDKSNARKLLHWIKNWHKNIASGKKPAFNRFNDDGSGCKAALLSGPPGVGKTTTATIVCQEAGFSYVELNASDTRSKKSLKEEVAESVNNTSLVGFFGGSNSNKDGGQNHCLIMDEVDGMAGNEDRGGMQELIAIIKSTKIPIICMCNDRNHQKIRSLANHCFDLRFQRPRLELIKSAMMTMAFKEGIKIPPPALNEIILASNQDVRQVIHNLSMWSADEKNLTYDQLKADANKAKKDMKMGPFDVVRKVFAGGEETKDMTINDKAALFFHDYSFGPLFVQENYITVNPYSARGNTKKHLQLLSQAADSLCVSDTIDRKIRGQQNWSLLPLQAIFASVLPGEYLSGNLGQQIQFPQWLGKNSTRGKNERILQELKSHMRLKVSCDKKELNMDYIPHLRQTLTRPLIQAGTEGVSQAIAQLDEYDLLKEDFDSILEVSQYPNSVDLMSKVETKVKSAFTRTYNKESHMTPYAIGNVAKKGRRGGGGAGMDDLDIDGEGGEGQGQVSDEEEDDNVDLDSMIKAKKASKGAATKGGKSATKGGGAKAGPSKGKGRGKGRGK